MKFPSNLEADYQADLGPEKIRALRQTGSLAALLYVSFGALDYWAIPSTYLQVWAIRGVVAVLTLLLVGVATWRPQVILSRYMLIAWTMYMIWGLGIVAMIALSQRSDLAWGSYYSGVMLACVALPASYLALLPTLTVGITYVGAYLFVAVWVQGMLTSQHWALLLMNCYFLVSANVIGIFVVEIRERHSREVYLFRHALNRDMETTKEAKRQSDFLAEHDMLTGMPNRIYFMRHLEAMIQHAKDAGATVTILFIDLDDFKPINDHHGHQVGDMVLRVVSERIRSRVRGPDSAARLGGDEFVVAVELDQQHLSSVDRLRRSLRDAIAGHMGIEGSELSVTASIGMAIYPFDANDAAELIRVADGRMYEAKRKSKATPRSAMPATVVHDLLGAADSTMSQPSW